MPSSAQLARRADARQHQQLRRVDRPAGEDHLAPARSAVTLAALDVIDADRAAPLDEDARGQRAGDARRDWAAAAPARR